MKNYHRLLFLVLSFIFLYSCNDPVNEYDGWGKYKGSDASINYSSLRLVDTTNVKTLQVAWVYRTGDADTVNHSQIQCNPIIVNGIMYGTSAQMKLFAIDGAIVMWHLHSREVIKTDYKENDFIKVYQS